ncbi:MAG TPA: ABC transporter substrate-binding protein [Acidimicrobiales bacterium]|nr:ABC transporter substrate-binding protein [Acidimicrobiales bacterium]
MRVSRLMAVPVVAGLILAACGDDDDGDGAAEEPAEDGEELTGTVTVFSAMEPEEVDALDVALDELVLPEVGYEVDNEGSGDFVEQFQIRLEGGNPPDIALHPQPGTVQEVAASGEAFSLEDLGFDIEELEATFGEHLLSLGEFEGEHYGLPTNVNLKSMIWYSKPAFDDAGYEIPETWDDLLALSDQIVADGGTPWCVGYEDGAASGWPATDWMEDIMLRTAGVDVYDQWWQHEIPFNDPAVVEAAETMGEIMFTEDYVLGGAEGTVSLAFGEAPTPMFNDPPGCLMHRQASFIPAFFPEDAVAGEDYDWFPFPPIDQEGTLFAGELAMVFRDDPEVIDFLERFASEPVQCAQGAEEATSRISPNVEVTPECYANDILADSAEVLTEAIESGTGRFDASDLMPAAVGSDSFWTAMLEYMQGGPDVLESSFEAVENDWPS